MNIDFFQEVNEKIKNTVDEVLEKANKNGIGKDEIELAEKLDAIEEFSIDRFEGNIAILENRINGEKREVEKDSLPNNIEEGCIIKCVNGKYFLDETITNDERKRITDKMNDLWK